MCICNSRHMCNYHYNRMLPDKRRVPLDVYKSATNFADEHNKPIEGFSDERLIFDYVVKENQLTVNAYAEDGFALKYNSVIKF